MIGWDPFFIHVRPSSFETLAASPLVPQDDVESFSRAMMSKCHTSDSWGYFARLLRRFRRLNEIPAA
jgi:hypothetical protein